MNTTESCLRLLMVLKIIQSTDGHCEVKGFYWKYWQLSKYLCFLESAEGYWKSLGPLKVLKDTKSIEAYYKH